MLTAAVITGIVLLAVTLYKFVFLNAKRPDCVCGHCGWEGNENELHAYSEDASETWVFHCPDCEKSKIIRIPKNNILLQGKK